MSGLAPLSNLTTIAPATTAANNTTPTAASLPNSAPSFLNGTLAQVSMIVLGLLFIAAGIFSFDRVRTLAVEGAKTGAKAAAA